LLESAAHGVGYLRSLTLTGNEVILISAQSLAVVGIAVTEAAAREYTPFHVPCTAE
jgi:hypothetical protein